MNAVNLIPGDRRVGRAGPSVSRPTLALIGGLVVVLAAAVVYVTTANTVATRNSELSQVSTGVAGWTAAANSYASFVQLAEQRTQQLGDVRQLASSRFAWSDLLGQIGGLMPRAAALSSLTATSTPSTSGTSGAPTPSVQLSACAASQSVVAHTIVQLRRVKGVSGVTLTTSTDSGTGSSSTGQGGGCAFPVQFQLSLTFKPSAAAATVSSGSASTTSTPATTAPAPATTSSTPATTASSPATTTPTLGASK
jgi:hypothetical protein